MAIPESFIQELNDRADIVSVVGRFVPLKKAGANFQGLCPFHDEKSPSFSVSPSKNFYHCFGCGAHGNAVRFLMEHQGMGFVDAVHQLAAELGMTVPSDQRSPEQRAHDQAMQARKQTITEALAQAARAYVDFLRKDTAAQDYLKGRGLTGEIAARFKLGWAPAGKPLAGVFADYADPILEEGGLVLQSQDGRRYDRFRERVMFPIRNLKGEVIGFGGRIIGAGEPKYLNSPETPAFHKGRELYGLYEGRSAIQQEGFALVTEGYMDVVALAQHGIANGVASLGTACTPEHVQKLFRFTDTVVFGFDGDRAGQQAARRVLPAVLPHANDMRVAKFLFLPAKHDPDSFVREYGRDAFLRLVHSATPLSKFVLDVAREDCDMSSTEGRSRFVSVLQPQWKALPEGALKTQLLRQIAELAELGGQELLQLWGLAPEASAPPARQAWQQTGRGWGRQATAPRPRPWLGARRTPHSRGDRALQLLLSHLAVWGQLSMAQQAALHLLPGTHGELLAWLEDCWQEEGPQSWPELRPHLPEDLQQLAQDLLNRLPDAQEREQQAVLEPDSLMTSDVQELAYIALELDLADAQAQSQALAASAASQPTPENFAAYQASLARIKDIKAAQDQRRGL